MTSEISFGGTSEFVLIAGSMMSLLAALVIVFTHMFTYGRRGRYWGRPGRE